MTTVANFPPIAAAHEIGEGPGPRQSSPPCITEAMLRVLAMGLNLMRPGVEVLSLSRVGDISPFTEEHSLAWSVNELVSCYSDLCDKLRDYE
jgi:hypothetical protein